ncbi:histone-lysine N-methyltransferase SETMAR-like [Aethina tumida]|uniref:histone-lysine N-methyltransferase SETMAR-like n=1 Tax=Aethina tumida TaxID=116153 RepID=UPI0021488506|nr:histone-lysine N-methyltransferase SETMAR-like [Aethina tumida]
MESDKQHFRHILLFYYRKGKNAVQARKKLTDVYGEDVLTVRQCQNWFAKFRSGKFDIEDAPRSGRPVEADKDAIKALVDANRRITTREIGLRLNLSNSTVHDHLKSLGFSSKLSQRKKKRNYFPNNPMEGGISGSAKQGMVLEPRVTVEETCEDGIHPTDS